MIIDVGWCFVGAIAGGLIGASAAYVKRYLRH